MKDKEKQFLLLRANGLSFDKITKEINVSKPTLIQWSRIYKDDINDMQFQTMRDLKDEYRYDRKAKYEQLLKHLKKFDKALDEIDISTVSAKELLQIRNDLNVKLEYIERNTTYINTELESTCAITGIKEKITIKLDEI